MPRIDAHQHFWHIDRDDYGWLDESQGVLYRTYLPSDLATLCEQHHIDGTILVQAAPTVSETRYLLELAAATPWVWGVVGWADLASPKVDDTLQELATSPLLRGIRPMIQDIPDPDWMLDAALTPGFERLVASGLRFDALVRPEHLPRLAELAMRHPGLPIVIDHGAKPDIAGGGFASWAGEIDRLAADPRIHCKLSGLVTEAAADWSDESLRPYVDHLLGCFGPERLMWGSDWPVVELAGGYTRWHDCALRLLEGLDDAARAAILGENALRFYGIEGNREAAGQHRDR